MRRPPAGLNVTRIKGQTECAEDSCKLKFLMMLASKMVASCKANVEPIQVRGPAPNGKYVKRWIDDFAGDKNREGS